jgi:O-antigen ligase
MLWNVMQYQTLYLEGFVFFLIGMLAFRRDDELRSFLLGWVGIGLAVAVIHFFCLATGFRFRDFAQAWDPTRDFHYGGVFGNANSMGAFYCTCLPVALVLFASGHFRGVTRIFLVGSLLAMAVSLIFAVHRGGIITNSILTVAAVAVASRRPGRALVTAALVGVGVTAGFFIVTTYLPQVFEASLHMAQYKGLETPRFAFWPKIMAMIATHPAGVGLAPGNMAVMGAKYGFDVTSAHNLYLALSAQSGLLALLMFLILVGTIQSRALRAWRLSSDPVQKTMMFALLLAVAGFLLVGLSESVWENGHKMNNSYQLIAGISLATSTRILMAVRRDRSEMTVEAGLEQASARGY